MNVQLTDKIESIFEHTLALIETNGFHGTPMSQIAKQSNVAIGTIYHYFPSKDRLIIELYYYCRKKSNKFIFEDLGELSYEDNMFVVFKRFCTFFIQNNPLFRFMEQFYNSPYFELAKTEHCQNPYEENKVIEFLQQGIKQNYIRDLDVRIITSIFMGTAVSFIKNVRNKSIEFDDEHIKELINIIWKGIKK